MICKYIPDGYWSSKSNGTTVSHEAICVLNVENKPVSIDLILYFENRDPMDGFHIIIESHRTKHIRMDKIINQHGEHVPMDIPYAIEILCSHDVSIQYSRVDTSQHEMAVATTIV